MIPKQALCTNFIEPTRGTIVDIAGMNIPPRFSTIFRDSFGKTSIHGMIHPP